MTDLKRTHPCDFFIPLDIDEFIVFLKDNVLHMNILEYLADLKKKNPNNLLFKMNYIIPIRTHDKGAFIEQCTHGSISDYRDMAKTFIQNSISNRVQIDHGNHIRTSHYILSHLYLIHYHFRSKIQHDKKVLNNILGLGYKTDVNYLKKLPASCMGRHHVKFCIELLENPNRDKSPRIVPFGQLPKDSISLVPFIDFFKKIEKKIF
jgi:hypothetical protein